MKLSDVMPTMAMTEHLTAGEGQRLTVEGRPGRLIGVHLAHERFVWVDVVFDGGEEARVLASDVDVAESEDSPPGGWVTAEQWRRG